jgi:signal transduction histidine kinase
MVNSTGNENDPDGLIKSSGEIFEQNRKKSERLSLIALFCLMAAVILIALNLRLPAGFLVICAASLGIMIYRNSVNLIQNFSESQSGFTTLREKQDEVIASFSHKIREPLNNLVIITDMLVQSGLTKKQQELLDTFIASTNNMVTTVNELSMQSAENIGYEHRKSIRFNLISTLENTFDLYSLKDQANLEFLLNKKELGEAEYFGDPIIIKQIFLDLFNIIEDHASEKAINVTINLKKTRETELNRLYAFGYKLTRTLCLLTNQVQNGVLQHVLSPPVGEHMNRNLDPTTQSLTSAFLWQILLLNKSKSQSLQQWRS